MNCGADRRNKSAFFLDSSGGVRLGPEPCSNRIFTSQVVNVLTHIAVTGLNLRHQTSVVSMHMILSLSGMIRTHMTQSLPQGSSPLFKMTNRHF